MGHGVLTVYAAEMVDNALASAFVSSNKYGYIA